MRGKMNTRKKLFSRCYCIFEMVLATYTSTNHVPPQVQYIWQLATLTKRFLQLTYSLTNDVARLNMICTKKLFLEWISFDCCIILFYYSITISPFCKKKSIFMIKSLNKRFVTLDTMQKSWTWYNSTFIQYRQQKTLHPNLVFLQHLRLHVSVTSNFQADKTIWVFPVMKNFNLILVTHCVCCDKENHSITLP